MAQIHGVEKGGCLLTLLRAEVITAVVHQHKLIGIHRRPAKAAHYAVGRLPSDWTITWASDKDWVMATGIHHQPRLQVVA